MANVQLNEVVLTPDLSIAKIYYVLLDREEADPEAQAALAKASGFIRRQLGDALDMRHIPELHFEWDAAVQKGRRIEELLSKIEYSDAPEED